MKHSPRTPSVHAFLRGLVASCWVLLFAAPVWAGVNSLKGKETFVPGEILVKFKGGTAPAERDRILSATGMARPARLRGVSRVELAPGRGVLEALEALKRDPAVQWAQPNYRYYASCALPSDAYFTTVGGAWRWHLDRIQAPAAWGLFSSCPPGDASVTVAVLDTGFTTTHPDLGGVATAPATNTVDGNSNAQDNHGHGTFVSSLIVAQWNASEEEDCDPGTFSTGMAGLAPGVVLMPVKVLDEDGFGSTLSVSEGIQYAAANGAKVINLSLGSPAFIGLPPIEREALDAALDADCVVVAAAGNEESASVNFPAGYPPVIAVGATNASDQVTWYSNFGSELDLVAPGGDAVAGFVPTEDILGASLECPFTADSDFTRDPSDSNFCTAAGTSAAAPLVAGAAALVRTMYPGLDRREVAARLMNTTDSLNGGRGWDVSSGYGRLNVHRALLAVPTATPEVTAYLRTFNSPNPFYPDVEGNTNITLAIPQAAETELTIVDGAGETVWRRTYSVGELNNNPFDPQYKSFYIAWDGRNLSGNPVKTGIYFYTVKTGGTVGRNKIALIRGEK